MLYDIFRDSISAYQRAVKAAKCNYLSELILRNSHKPNIFFSKVESVLHPNVNLFPETSVSLCEDFARHFNKISQITSLMPLSAYKLPDIPITPSTWSVFEPVNLNTLIEIVYSKTYYVSPGCYSFTFPWTDY